MWTLGPPACPGAPGCRALVPILRAVAPSAPGRASSGPGITAKPTSIGLEGRQPPRAEPRSVPRCTANSPTPDPQRTNGVVPSYLLDIALECRIECPLVRVLPELVVPHGTRSPPRPTGAGVGQTIAERAVAGRYLGALGSAARVPALRSVPGLPPPSSSRATPERALPGYDGWLYREASATWLAGGDPLVGR